MHLTAKHLVAAAVTITAATTYGGAPGGTPIWGAKSMAGGPIPSTSPANLFMFTVANPGGLLNKGAITLGGNPIDVDGLAQLPSSALVGFEITAGGSRLISINASTAVAMAIGPVLAGRDIRGAVARPDGVLIAIDAADNTIMLISSTTGLLVGAAHALRIGCAPYDLSTGADLAICSDGLLLLVSLNQFLAVDSATGLMQLQHVDSLVMPDGFAPFIGGLAFEPASPIAAAYELNALDDLVTYDTAAAFARTILLINIIPAFNAGRGDLACFVNATPAPLPAAVLADLNGDGMIDGADLGLMLGEWGPCPTPPALCCADLNGDGVVDGADFGILLSAWG